MRDDGETNSFDEEDDRTSSWESEPEGENAEELASKETPDEERMARQSRRIGSRPAFHYLAEDDEGEQASGGLNHLLSRHAGGAKWTWKKVTVVVDSGAAENVMLRSIFPPQANREVQGRKRVQRTRRREHQELWAASHVRQDP